MNREIAVAILQSRGMKVVTAANGEAGVHAFMDSAEHEYDTILMDLRMPVMDGLEASRKIRALDRADAKTIPIIAMTADVFHETILAAKEAGMNEYVTKPIDQDSLFKIPLLGPFLTKWGMIPVARESGGGNSLIAAHSALENGAMIGIYYEGTITLDPAFWPMKEERDNAHA